MCSTLFGNFACHCCTSNVVNLYRNGNAIVPLAPVPRTYPGIFESANFSLRIQKFPRPHVSVFKSNLPVHTYPDSLSVRQLICKAIFDSREKFKSPVCFTNKIVPSSTIFQDFFFKVVLMHQLFLATTVGTWRI